MNNNNNYIANKKVEKILEKYRGKHRNHLSKTL